MKRIHAFEFEDLRWFPRKLRNYGTDFLQWSANAFDIYKGAVPVIEKGLESSATSTVIDIASGGGGGLLNIAPRLKQRFPELKILLSDYYPNVAAFQKTKAALPDVFEYVEVSVNAMNVPQQLKGFRTQFLSFHHFKPKDATAILQNALDNGQPVGIFEAQQRNGANLLRMLLSPLAVLIATPFIKPFRAERLLFTYLLPVVPLFILWDGLVSVLRTYTETELREMIAGLKGGTNFDWEVGSIKESPNPVLYLLGTPRRIHLT